MDVCLRVLKESNKRSFDRYSVWNSVLIISHITFRDRGVHIVYDSVHVDQVYRKQYIRNKVKILLSRGRHVHRKTYKQKNRVDEIADASRDFPWDF